MDRANEIAAWIEVFRRETAEHPVFVYAKGEKNFPMCGFSHRVMQVLDGLDVDYRVRNILEDDAILDALEAWTDWPTSPQVFVGGEFIGGCDITVEMARTGELQEMIRTAVSRKTSERPA